MLVFSVNHVRFWEHDVRGCGQRMGGHHFMSLFTLLPSHIELHINIIVFSVLSSHLPIILGWGPYSACMLWLDTLWVLDLADIFRSYLLFFNAISPHWHHHYKFSLHHISTLVMFIFSSFSSSLLTWHYLRFTLSGGFFTLPRTIFASPWVVVFSPYHVKDGYICSLFHFIGSGSKILVWEVVLSVRILVTLVRGESLSIWLCISIGDCSVLIRVYTKNQK